MKAFRFGTPTLLPGAMDMDAGQPVPAAGEVLVRVHAAGVTPTEAAWYPTTHTKGGDLRARAIPGHEFSGVVAALGAGVTSFQTGQPVYGMNDWFAEGATAEYCVAEAQSIAAKPQRLTHAEAASVPISVLTAWQGLFDRAKLKSGERVLIHGGSGGVGVFAIQLAKRAGAEIITTASARNAKFLMQLGAAKVIDYHTEDFGEIATDIDVVFDAVGGDTLKRSWNLLRPGGRLVTIASDSEGTFDERTKQAFFIVEPHQKQLIEIAALLDSQQLVTFVDAIVPFEQASLAYAGEIKEKKGRGKMVIAIVPG